MPSLVSQRKKLDISNAQPVSVVQQIANGDTAGFIRLLPPSVEAGHTAGNSSCQRPVTPGMSSATNPNHSQIHPIDELTCEPVDINGRSSQPHTESSTCSNTSSDFGPFVSGFGDDPRPRSSSFNSNMLRRQRTSAPPQIPVDPLQRLSETQTMIKTSSAENVTAAHEPYPHTHVHLRHSNTAPEFPPLSLSNDSGYHTPPQNRQQPHPGHNTSPPWPPNRLTQWPLHASPPTHYPPISTQNHPSCVGVMTGQQQPQLRPLTIDTGHYQPEPIHSHPPFLSMQPPVYSTGYHQQRSNDQYSSLQSQGSATPEEGICAYQHERKMRLAAALKTEEMAYEKLQSEEQQITELIILQRESNSSIDNSATEKEVESMKRENKILGGEIQVLMQDTPRPMPALTPPHPDMSVPTSSSTLVHIGMPSVAPMPLARHPSPSRPLVPQSTSPSYPEIPIAPPFVPARPPVPPRTPAPPMHSAEESPQWACSQCTYLNHPLIEVCEVCETPRPRAGIL